MGRLTDYELLSLVANALHHSGPEGNPERADIRAAYTRAAALLAAIEGAGVIAIRQERQFPSAEVTTDPDSGGMLLSW